MDMHSPFKRDEVGSIPPSRTKCNKDAASHNGSMLRASTSDDESSNLSAASKVGMWSNG